MRHFNRVSFIYTLLAVLITLMAGAGMAQTDFWEQTNGPFGGTVNSLAINSNGDIFAGTDGDGVFRSSDNGDNWTQINAGLTNTKVRALAINSSGEIFVGTLSGVFRSTDNGDNWSPINTGLTQFDVVIAFAINSSGDIFAGTFGGGGLFRHVESPTAVEEISSSIPSSFALEQNYPNPFNPETIIRYQLDRTAEVKLEIYNIVGERVTTLVDKKLSSGAYFVTWHGSDALGRPVASGVYIYRLQTDSFVESKKMLLLR